MTESCLDVAERPTNSVHIQQRVLAERGFFPEEAKAAAVDVNVFDC